MVGLLVNHKTCYAFWKTAMLQHFCSKHQWGKKKTEKFP